MGREDQHRVASLEFGIRNPLCIGRSSPGLLFLLGLVSLTVQLVVIATRQDKDGVCFYTVDETVFLSNTAGPTSLKIMLQSFRLAKSFKRMTLGISNKLVDFFESAFAGLMPVEIILPSVCMEANMSHSSTKS